MSKRWPSCFQHSASSRSANWLGRWVARLVDDCFGQRAALTFSVAAMALSTFLIGLLPGYETIGVLAPAWLTLLRVVVSPSACKNLQLSTSRRPITPHVTSLQCS